jgi:hypothetical protein
VAVAVGRGTGVSEGTAVTSGSEVGSGSLQAATTMERTNRKDVKVANLLNGFMGKSFVEENISQLYKQAALTSGL